MISIRISLSKQATNPAPLLQKMKCAISSSAANTTSSTRNTSYSSVGRTMPSQVSLLIRSPSNSAPPIPRYSLNQKMQ
ncbi:hypothetical protein FGO68_gene11919 [Halteria grandinella]|uniref:Uncharacterized protein n=1 Tax=Halteria grandinella TaxID=5974 RepID=A0A8J8STM2_HALGN|nr:hypothetical protein FGO68_gene11919 [Halteria grandinella]